jgi:hypothetical protein
MCAKRKCKVFPACLEQSIPLIWVSENVKIVQKLTVCKGLKKMATIYNGLIGFLKRKKPSPYSNYILQGWYSCVHAWLISTHFRDLGIWNKISTDLPT